MENIPRQNMQTIVIALLYVMLFLVLIPLVVKFMDERWGEILYGVLALGAVLVAFRLRTLFREHE